MQNPNSVNWLILPDSHLYISLHERPSKLPRIEITGNPRGMVSIANIFLWLASPTTDFDSISITALPFISVDSALSLTAHLLPEDEVETKYHGKLVRLDKSVQYEWQASEQQIINVTLLVHQLGCTPETGDYGVSLNPNSDADMRFELISYEQ